jgi:hydrogenase maturation factor
MADLVDIALPAAAQAVAETLGLTVQRSVTSGARIRTIPRDEAELAIEYLREWGFTARIVDHTPGDEPSAARAA